MQAAENLVRKQFLISPAQVRKLELIAKKKNTSAAEVVRNAIESYNPDLPANMGESELLELVSSRVKEAIEDTKKVRAKLNQTLERLEA